MKSNTRLLGFLEVWQNKLTLKFWLFETQFPISLFVFFLGFMNGNLFGTILIFFRQWIIWDVIIIILTILFIELYLFLFDFKIPNFKIKSITTKFKQ